MKKSKFFTFVSVFAALFFLFTFYTSLWGQGKPSAEELEQLRSAQSIQIILEESYGSAKNIHLPVKDTVTKLLVPTGLKQVGANADVILKIVLRGQAISRHYYSRSGGESQIGYTGASISGNIFLKIGDRWFFKKYFSGRLSPSSALLKGALKNPASGTFERAFSRSSFIPKIMESLKEIKGNALLITYLKNNHKEIRKEAAILLGNLKDLKINDAAAVNTLITALKDKEYQVRADVVKVLGEIKDPISIDPLINLLRDERNTVRHNVRKALAKIDPDWKKRGSCKNLIPSFISGLNNTEYDIRAAAVEFFVEVYDERALKPLMKRMIDKNYTIRKKTVEALDKNFTDWRTGEQAKKMMPVFIAALKKPTVNVRKGAISALLEIGGPGAMKPLIDTLKDKDLYIRESAFKAVKENYKEWGSSEAAKKVIPFFVRDLRAGSLETRRLAARILADIKDPRVEKPLISALKDRDPLVKCIAAAALAESGDPSVVKPLIAVLNDKNASVRQAAVTALGNLNTPGSIEVEPIIALLEDKYIYVRKETVEALGKKKDARTVEPLIALLNDKNKSIKTAAAIALGEQNDPRAVKPLMDLLKSSDWKLRSTALKGLVTLGDLIPIESLLAILKEKDDKVRNCAWYLLRKIKNPKIVDTLITLLKSENIEVRKDIIYILEILKDYRAVEPLIEILNTSSDKWEQRKAIDALKSITEPLVEQKDSRAVRPLIEILKSKDTRHRTYIFKTLEKLADIVPVESLIMLLKAKNDRLSNQAQDLLIKTKNPEAVPILITSLKKEDTSIRKKVIYVLGVLKDYRAVEPLMEILKSSDKWGKKSAAGALKSITGKDYGVKYKKWKKWWKKNKDKVSS